MIKYNFERQFIEVFRQNGLDIGLLLRNCHLPEDLFGRTTPLVTADEYFTIVEEAGRMVPDAEVVLNIATAQQVETFVPATFMAYCSDCGLNFLRRFAEYDRLVAPVRISLREKDEEVHITFQSIPNERPLPSVLVEFKMAYLVNFLRKATLQHIVPVRVECMHTPFSAVIQDYLECDIRQSDRVRLTLQKSDLLLPFTSRNDTMLRYIEPELQRRLHEMEENDDIGTRVCSALTELLPIGKTRIEDVAAKLCMSVRTLQRRLKEEQTTFQKQLNTTRMLQAKAYLRNGVNTSEEVAFLLGYEDTTSFIRAFNSWTNMTVSQFLRKTKEY